MADLTTVSFAEITLKCGPGLDLRVCPVIGVHACFRGSSTDLIVEGELQFACTDKGIRKLVNAANIRGRIAVLQLASASVASIINLVRAAGAVAAIFVCPDDAMAIAHSDAGFPTCTMRKSDGDVLMDGQYARVFLKVCTSFGQLALR
jgi:hypothetical protein